MEQEESRLNLKESFYSFLEKSKLLHAHLAEDWAEISPRCRYSDLPQLLSDAIDVAETALHEHRHEWRGESPEQKQHRRTLKEAQELYRELYETILYLKPDDVNWKSIQEKYGPTPAKRFLGLALKTCLVCFEESGEIPSYLPHNLREIVNEITGRIDDRNFFELGKSTKQIALREKRDHAFRELRSIVAMVKETGRFAFRKQPDMKRRYR